MSRPIIPFPQELRPKLPTIVGNVDYLTLRQRLEQIDSLLHDGGVERDFVERALAGWKRASKTEPSAREQGKFQQRSRRALRCTILRTLVQEDYRGFSCQLAGNPLYQWFCRIDALDQVRVPSKSEVQRFAHWLPAEQMRQVIDGLLKGAVEKPRQLDLKEALDLEAYFLDSTCLKANIHFPTDWVLLRDGVRTLMKATRLIRKAGLRGRMEAPEEFLRRMNRLSIEMSQQARRAGRKKGRKRVLRQMKKLVGVVRAHARRHRQLLDQQWEQTEWTRAQAQQIVRRIDGVLELLPQAQKQAHERIIGERSVANGDKILSLYDPEVRVIVRGKAGAEVEFGNTVLLYTRSGYRDTFRLFLSFLTHRHRRPIDQLTLETVNPAGVLAFLEHLETTRGNTPRTRNLRLAAIRTFVRFVIGESGGVEFMGIAQRILAIPQKKSPKLVLGFMTREEIDALLAAIDLTTYSGRRDRLLFMLLYNTGARISEALQLRPQDLIGRAVHLRGKGRKERSVPIWPVTEQLLRKWCKANDINPEQLFFTNRNGGPLSRDGVAFRLALAVRNAEKSCPSLKNRRITCHTFRHSCAMALLQAGVALEVIALWLGHAKPLTTHGYIEADLKMKTECLKRLNEPKTPRRSPAQNTSRLLAFLEAL